MVQFHWGGYSTSGNTPSSFTSRRLVLGLQVRGRLSLTTFSSSPAGHRRAVQCSAAVKCSVVHCTVTQFSAVLRVVQIPHLASTSCPPVARLDCPHLLLAVLHCSALQCTALHCYCITSLYCSAMHCSLLHCSALHFIALQLLLVALCGALLPCHPGP